MSAAAWSGVGPSPSAGTAHMRWRTPSSSTTSTSGAVAVSVARRTADSPVGSSYRTMTGLVLTPGRAEQLVTVFLGAGQGPFVGQHARPRTERLEAEPGEEPALGPLHGAAGDDIGLLVDVDRRVRVLAQGAVRAPCGEGPGSAAVAIVRGVTCLVRGQVKPHDVDRMARDEGRALLGRDHVVRWRHDEPEVSDDGRIEPEGTERADLGHMLLGECGSKADGSWDAAIVRYERADREILLRHTLDRVCATSGATFTGVETSLLRSSHRIVRRSRCARVTAAARAPLPRSCRPPRAGGRIDRAAGGPRGRPGRRRGDAGGTHDGGPTPVRGARAHRVLDGDRRAPQERRATDRRRDPA